MRTSKEKQPAGAAAPGGTRKAEGEKPEDETKGAKPEGEKAETKEPAEGEDEGEGEAAGRAPAAEIAAATEAARKAGHAAGRAEALAEAQTLAETCELAGLPARELAALLKAGKTGAAGREAILAKRDAAIAGQTKISGQHEAGLGQKNGAAAWDEVMKKTNARHGFAARP